MKRFLHYLLCWGLCSLGLASLWSLFCSNEGFSVNVVLQMLPITMVIGAVILIVTSLRGKGDSNASAAINSRTEAEDLAPAPITPRAGFDDIAGYEPVKDYLLAIAKKLADPDRRKSLPHGILLYGPPGTGKTLFARAMAGEVDCPFFSVTASEFTNRLVGQGARNVRKLYAAARKHPVSIVFIDEIDAIGKARKGDTNQEERMTLNQLLSELDGFDKDGPFVLTIAATNDFDGLDDALTRAGRFDRKLSIPEPNYRDRLAILTTYTSKFSVSPDANLAKLANTTEGFSGAKLTSLIREAQTAAESRGSDTIEPCDIDLGLIRVITNGEPVLLTDPEERRATAYHEAGHAIAAKLLLGQDVPKVSIMGSTSGLAGWTLHVWPDDYGQRTRNKEDAENSIVLLYAGRVAELSVGVPLNMGSNDDISEASQQIKSFVQKYGFGDSPLNTTVFDGTGEDTVKAAKELAKTLYAKAEEFIASNQTPLDAVAQALLQHETLDNDAVDKILRTA